MDFLIDIHNPINNIRVGFRSYKLHNDIMVVAKLCLFYCNLPTNVRNITFMNEKVVIVTNVTWKKDLAFSWSKWVKAECLS